MYTKGLVLRIEVPIQLILHPVTLNSKPLYLIRANKYVRICKKSI